MKDIQKYRVIKEIIEKKIKAYDAVALLSLSYVHISRLKKRVLNEGFEGLLRKIPVNPPNKKLSDLTINEILNLRKDFYCDFNVMHFKDKLEGNHNIHLCYESLRQILVKAGYHHPKKKKIVHRQRRRMPKSGMLIQMDSSLHQWLADIPENWWLIMMIDDATNEIPYAKFFTKDTLFANMHVLRKFIEIKGIFMSLYVDKASHFTTTRHGGLHYNINPEQEDTQIERALDELGITLIPANSPQAKGRIEVTFRLFQDRLIKEMRLAGIKNYNDADKFLLEVFLPEYSKKYTHDAESIYMPIPKDKNLDLIFCIKQTRTVNHDNTVSLYGQIIQIPPATIKLSFSKSKVDVCLLEDNRIFVLYKDNIIAESILSKDNKIIKKEKRIEELLNKRDYEPIQTHKVRKKYIPPDDHPWRKSFRNWIKLKQIKKTKIELEAEKEIEKLFGGMVEIIR